MPATMLKTLANALSITGVAIQAGIALNESPFLGGAGRNAILALDAPVGGAGVILVQGHAGLPGKTLPASGDAGWTTIVTLNAASPLEQEIALPLYIRTNISVLGTGTITAKLKGVQ